jgi:hypothetical protein
MYHIPKYNHILNSKGMELKINNQTKQFRPDSLTVQTLFLEARKRTQRYRQLLLVTVDEPIKTPEQ